MIVFTQFKKRFKGTAEHVLDIADVVLENKIYWLKGKNGVGKSSLIKSMAGIIPFEGKIVVNNMDIKKDRMAYRLKINYAEAEPDYPGFLRGTDLIDLYTYTKKATKSQVSSLIRKFEIAHYINKKAGAYSSGMSKKLSLLLAFIGSPELILLDEPFITLDPQALNIVENLIAEYHKAGAAFIIASHQHFAFSDPLYATTISLVNKTISFE